MIIIRRVLGASMLPTYRPGTVLLGLKWLRPREGRIVIAERQGREIVKRIRRLGDQGVYVLGDNPGHSSDSRSYGWIPFSRVKGVVVWSISMGDR